MRRQIDWDGAGVVLFLVVLVVLLGVVTALMIRSKIEMNRVHLLCLEAGYESSTAYLRQDRADYCHKRVDGTSVTVPLTWGEGR